SCFSTVSTCFPPADGSAPPRRLPASAGCIQKGEPHMETHFEKTLESQVVYKGRVITVTRDTALLECGPTALLAMLHHHGGAYIPPYSEDGTICMVRQLRYAMQQELWELPAGKLEAGEDTFEAAKRELTEECGVCADEYIPLGQIYPTVGYDTEIIYIWAARGLHPAAMHLDADEFLTPERIPRSEEHTSELQSRFDLVCRLL